MAASEHRRAGTLRCLDDRTMAATVPDGNGTIRWASYSARCATDAGTQDSLSAAVRAGAARAVRRPSQLVGATTRTTTCARSPRRNPELVRAALVLDIRRFFKAQALCEAPTLELAATPPARARRGATRTRARCAVTRPSMWAVCGTGTVTSARSRSSRRAASGRRRCCSVSSMTARVWPAICSGISPRTRRTSRTVFAGVPEARPTARGIERQRRGDARRGNHRGARPPGYHA